MPGPDRDQQARRSAFSPTAMLAVSGPVLLMLGLGSVWRSLPGLVVGLVFLSAGAALITRTFVRYRRELRARGEPVPRLAVQVLMLGLAVAAGSAVYLGLLALADRS